MSNILSDYAPEFLNTKFKEDLTRFLNLKEDDVNVFLQYLIEINEDMNSEETLNLIKKLETELENPYTKDEIIGILRLIHLFTYILVKVNNVEVLDIVENLLSLDIITVKNKEIATKYITLIQQGITYEIRRLILANANNLFFPRLIDIKCAAAIKAITNNDEVESYLPIASIYISVKDDAREKIYFQATTRDINSIIKKLKKIQKTLSILEEKSRTL